MNLTVAYLHAEATLLVSPLADAEAKQPEMNSLAALGLLKAVLDVACCKQTDGYWVNGCV